ncbi:MAG: oxidoreductase [Ruminococcaceae bacterium]|nr:oxidoreductase [Oscillospiraceae bacterium]
MIYKDFQGLKLSALGFGTMRLPLTDTDPTHIDEGALAEMVAYALDHGVNYFDTAWGYHGGQSELAIGRALKQYPRDSFYLASKFPGYDLANMGKVEEIFERQLEKCGVEYFDFYLIHNVCERNINEYLDRSYRTYEYLMQQKANGRIRHLGFSIHGSQEVLERFLAAYGEGMEFCQVQLNYLDWDFQDAKSKVALLNERGIAVWVMEPLRGGKLANVGEEERARLAALRPETTVPAWAFRFLQSIPGVTVTLSGMSNLQQMQENIRTYETEEPLNAAEMEALLGLAADMVRKTALPCTACRYCTAHCPMELDIPALLELYNEYTFTGGGFLAPMRVNAMPKEKQPSACIGCRSCETLCPQGIHIADVLADFAEKLK